MGGGGSGLWISDGDVIFGRPLIRPKAEGGDHLFFWTDWVH